MNLKHFATLNLALFIISTAAPLGNYISLPPAISIWTRCFVAFLGLGILVKFQKISLQFQSKDTGSFVLAASLQGLHWVTYFYSLQLAGAGLGIISLFTYPIFTAILEPFILKTKFNPKHIFLGLLVLIGLYILTPEFELGNQVTLGIVYGVASAIFYATRNILMKKHVTHYNSIMLMFYQVGIISLLMLPVFFIFPVSFETYKEQIPFLLFLGIFTTATGHTLLVKAFSYFSATTASLLSCMQPLYGILLAFFFLDEVPKPTTIYGGICILSAVALESLLVKKQ